MKKFVFLIPLVLISLSLTLVSNSHQAKSESDKIYMSFRPEISSKSWLHRIQADECPGGISACGQFCNDIERGNVPCEDSRPCYDKQGRCFCVNRNNECD
jgi:hypothetical protein